MFIIGIGSVMFVAIDTFKLAVIRSVHMAIGAGIPFTLMFSRIDGKILSIVIPVSRFPGCGSMAVFTSCREICRLMIGVGCTIVIFLMAGNAGRGCIGISRLMAVNTI